MTRPVDPLEEESRALAIAAGVDPDSRIEVPGKPRGMPAWCGFRDAARAARQARRAEEVSATLGPQPAAYANAPLTVFGEHEAGTLGQMRNCLGVGQAVAGVLCADGHLGYAQPVGGVIAYEGQISVSGVGFDIGCGNMAVRLDTSFADLRDRVPEILGDIRRVVSFGIGRANAERAEHALFDDEQAWRAAGMEDYRQKAAAQLGTVGALTLRPRWLAHALRDQARFPDRAAVLPPDHLGLVDHWRHSRGGAAEFFIPVQFAPHVFSGSHAGRLGGRRRNVVLPIGAGDPGWRHDGSRRRCLAHGILGHQRRGAVRPGVCMVQAMAPSRWLISAPMRWIAERSFSVYLLHPFAVIVLGHYQVYAGLFAYLGAAALLPCVVITLALVLPMADATYRMIERPGQHWQAP